MHPDNRNFSDNTISDKQSLDELRAKFIRAQKRKIAITLIILIVTAILLFVWKAYDARKQEQEQMRASRNSQIQQIQSQMLQADESSSDVDTVFARQNQITEAIKKSQPLPIMIDPVSSITDVFFKDNSLLFRVEINNEKLKPDEQEKMKDTATINQILLKNKTVACNLMKNLPSWDGNWSVSYEYYFKTPLEMIGSISFEYQGC
ncbi:MAG: hypothetical protein ACI4VX_03750 [Succinivibrionaceae bacterium]